MLQWEFLIPNQEFVEPHVAYSMPHDDNRRHNKLYIMYCVGYITPIRYTLCIIGFITGMSHPMSYTHIIIMSQVGLIMPEQFFLGLTRCISSFVEWSWRVIRVYHDSWRYTTITTIPQLVDIASTWVHKWIRHHEGYITPHLLCTCIMPHGWFIYALWHIRDISFLMRGISHPIRYILYIIGVHSA